MKPIVYVGMAGLAGALALVMFLRDQGQETSLASGAGEERFLPELGQRINDVATLSIEHAGSSFSITRGDETWGLAEKGNYPVDMAKVRQLLISLSEAEVIEEKTSSPELYERLGVQDPDESEESSTRLTLLDQGGTKLASMIVGDRRAAAGGMPTAGASPTEAYYLRKDGEAASWLVSGKLSVDGEESGWLEREVLNVDRERIAAARIEHGDGEVLAARKSGPEEANFELSDVPEDRELRYEGVANTFGSSLSNLSLDDVVPASDFEFSDPLTARANFWTFDHMRVDVELEERDEKLYARFEAAYDESGPTAPGALGPPVEVEKDEGEEAPPDEGAEEEESDELTPEEVRAEVESINAKVAQWIYVLPSWKKSSFVKRMDEMLKELPEESAEGEEGGLESGLEGLMGEGGEMSDEALQKLLEDASSGSEDAPLEDQDLEHQIEESLEEAQDEDPPVESGEEAKDDSEGEEEEAESDEDGGL